MHNKQRTRYRLEFNGDKYILLKSAHELRRLDAPEKCLEEVGKMEDKPNKIYTADFDGFVWVSDV